MKSLFIHIYIFKDTYKLSKGNNYEVDTNKEQLHYFISAGQLYQNDEYGWNYYLTKFQTFHYFLGLSNMLPVK